MTVAIRVIEARDEARWFELWDGYCKFYKREPDEPVARYTWQRIRDVSSSVKAIVAEKDGRVIGIANYVMHENTATLAPVCYLQDLYVDPVERAVGVGAALIDWLVAQMHAHGWARLYWATQESNYRARGLYDKYTPHSGFLRYVLDNKQLKEKP